MDARLQRRVQRYGWDKAAAYYEQFWQDQLKPAHDLLMEMAELEAGERVLDVACGTGLVSFRASSHVGKAGSVMGVDISDKMIAQARVLMEQAGAESISFERMDGEELEDAMQTFDVAICALGLMYMPDPGKALAAMRSVVKPGGRVVAAVWGKRDACGWAGIFEIVDRHVASEVCPLFFHLGNPDLLKMTMEAAGLQDITIHRIKTVLSYKDAGDALGAAFDGGPVALAYHKFSDATKQEVHAAYLDSIEPYKRGCGYEIPGEFVVGRGIC